MERNSRFLIARTQKAQDRFDIVIRVFHFKVKKFMELMVKRKIFGPVDCYSYSIEWQKR